MSPASLRRPSATVIASLAVLALGVPVAEATSPHPAPASIFNLRSDVPDEATWQKDTQAPLGEARSWIEQELPTLPSGTKPAITLDIDNTSLATYWHKGADTIPAAKATLELAQWAKDKGIAVYFVTARSESGRDQTLQNLKEVGYEVDGLYMKVHGGGDTGQQKEAARKAITEQEGFRIVANIGNNDHDVQGGYQDKGFLLPNYGGELS